MYTRIFQDLLSLNGFRTQSDTFDRPARPADETRYARPYGNRDASARMFARYGRHQERVAPAGPDCTLGACG